MHKKRTFKEFNEMLDRLQAADPLHGSRAITATGDLAPVFHGSPNMMSKPSLADANPIEKKGLKVFVADHPKFSELFSGPNPSWIPDPSKIDFREEKIPGLVQTGEIPASGTGYMHKFFLDMKKPLNLSSELPKRDAIRLINQWRKKGPQVIEALTARVAEQIPPELQEEALARVKKAYYRALRESKSSLSSELLIKMGLEKSDIRSRTLRVGRLVNEVIRGIEEVFQDYDPKHDKDAIMRFIAFDERPPSLNYSRQQRGNTATLLEKIMGHDGVTEDYPFRMPDRKGEGYHTRYFKEYATGDPKNLYTWSSPEVQRAKRSRNAQRKVMELARKQGIKLPKRKVGLFLAALTALAGMGYAFGAPEGESA